MSITPLNNLSRLCIHTITTRAWSIETAAHKYSAAGVAGITVWRQALDGTTPRAAASTLASAGLEVVSLARGGFFPAVTAGARQTAIEQNRRALEECEILGAPVLVLVCGAVPEQSIETDLGQIRDGIETLLPQAQAAGVRLAIEPLHPMYADTRSAIVKMKTANDLCAQIDSSWLGITVDCYHVWWDPDLESEIERAAAASRLLSFHICDWKTPPEDMLNDRGLMGEGVIDIRGIRGMMERNGFEGYNEVEIFSNRWWAGDQDFFLEEIVRAYRECS